MSNKGFADKKEYYKDSNIKTTGVYKSLKHGLKTTY